MGWIELALLVVSFIAAAVLMPKAKIENARASDLSSITTPQASEGSPIPMVWGRVQLKGPNTLWYGDFKAVPNTRDVKSGLFGHQKQIQSWGYFLGLDLGLCLGENVSLYKIWAGKNLIWASDQSLYPLRDTIAQVYPDYVPTYVDGAIISGVSTDPQKVPNPADTGVNSPSTGIPVFIAISDQSTVLGGLDSGGGYGGGFGFYSGNMTQQRDPYVATFCGSDMPGYNGISHIVFAGFYWGTSTNLPQLEFEVSRYTDNLGLGTMSRIGNFDQNPMEVLYSFMIGGNGGMQLDAALIKKQELIDAGVTLYNESMGMSMIVDTANAASDIIKEITRHVNGVLYHDPTSGMIGFRLIRNDYDIAALPVLDESNILEMSDYTVQNWSQTFNQVRVKYMWRDNGYVDGTAIDQDLANVNYQGRVLSSDLSFPLCYDSYTAVSIAKRELSMVQVPLYKCTLKVNRIASTWIPGTVIKLNWPEGNITNQVFRISKINLGTLTDGQITLDLVQDAFASNVAVMGTPVSYSPQLPSERPYVISTRKVMEAPLFLVDSVLGSATVGMSNMLYLAAAPSPYSQTFSGYESSDNWATNRVDVLGLLYPTSGPLRAAYNTAADTLHDTGSTGLVVQGVTPGDAWINGATDAQLRTGVNLILVEDEFMNFANYTVNGDGSVKLTNLRRGLLDSSATSHALGAQVWFVNDGAYLADATVPQTSTVKVRVVDKTSTSEAALSGQPADTLTMNSRLVRPLHPGYMMVGGSRTPAQPITGTVVVSWRERNRLTGASSLYWDDDATDTPEAGTTYVLRYSADGGQTWTEISCPTATGSFTPTESGIFLVQVFAVLGGLRSFAPLSMSYSIQGVDMALQTRAGDYVQGRDGIQIVAR